MAKDFSKKQSREFVRNNCKVLEELGTLWWNYAHLSNYPKLFDGIGTSEAASHAIWSLFLIEMDISVFFTFSRSLFRSQFRSFSTSLPSGNLSLSLTVSRSPPPPPPRSLHSRRIRSVSSHWLFTLSIHGLLASSVFKMLSLYLKCPTISSTFHLKMCYHFHPNNERFSLVLFCF